MKTRIFALLNIITLFIFTATLEFASSSEAFTIIIIGASILFIISGSLSVFRKSIWRAAHENYATKSNEYLKDMAKLVPSVIVSFVVIMSIVADFIDVKREFVMFISYVVVYLSLFIPCHLVIFKHRYLLKSSD